MSQSYLRWKYLENPFLQRPVFVVIRHGDQIVGMRGLFGTCWNVGRGKDPAILPHADDLIIHPDHRNRGLFLRIHDATVAIARERGFSSLISLSGSEITQELSIACGWRSLGELERIYRYPSRSSPPAKRNLAAGGFGWRGRYRPQRIARRFGYAAVKPPSNRSVDKALQEIVTITSPKIQISRQADYAGMSHLAESVPSDSFRAFRSEAFLRWRLNNPHRKYRFLYWRDSRLRGYIVLAWTGRDANRVTIADHTIEDPGVFTELLDALVQSQSGEISMMSSMLSNSLLQTAIAAGFSPDLVFEKNQRRRFLFYPMADPLHTASLGEGSASCPEHWRVSLLDTMAA